jgi:GT2 family glycosyltransferase
LIVVDNGSDDGTAGWVAAAWPQTLLEVSETPLSFARAVNRGIRRAGLSHVCLLNNDMLVEPGFFAALLRVFDRIPGLFCSTAQIVFPPGVRREETGKAVMAHDAPTDFPVRCDEPLPGEDETWVLYGSGGCSLYDAAKLHALGDVDEAFEPAYVEDLDLGYRGWQRGWPSVYVAGALVEHRHRATTSRYFDEHQLERILEINYLRFLARAVASPPLFRELWGEAIMRLHLLSDRPACRAALREAWRIALDGGPLLEPEIAESDFLALTDGSASLFPGHGHAAVLVAARDRLQVPPTAELDAYREVTIVRGERAGRAFHAAVDQARRKWTGISVVTSPR